MGAYARCLSYHPYWVDSFNCRYRSHNKGQTCGTAILPSLVKTVVRKTIAAVTRSLEVDTFLQKAQDTYFDLRQQDLVLKPGGVKPSVAMAKFKPFNPDPNNLKRIPDSAQQLLDELQGLGVNTRRLKPREKSRCQSQTFTSEQFRETLRC